MSKWIRWILPIAYATVAAAGNSLTGIEFNRDIRPILAESCFECHGPADDTREADLRLDDRESALADRGGYQVVAAGKPAASEILRRITGENPVDVMPPAESGRQRLSPAQIELIRQWIEQGASWQQHWAFVAPRRPAPPQSDASQAWGRNPIDSFTYSRMSAEGLRPNPEADRHTLGRRLALDLTGLPPMPEEFAGFVNDTSAEAYERYVARLLASSAYGEHQARYWLDAARFADTHGMHLDNYREMWLYRDWVIEAFDKNLPFDRFVVEQLAGDLLPQATTEQQIATGFVRCNVTSSEAGSIPKELAVRYGVDRVATLGTVFLGLTVGCAQCHDHKFDPISQHEFYRLYAFFNNAAGSAMDGNRKDTPPVAVVPDSEHRDAWKARLAREAELQSAMNARIANLNETYGPWREKQATSVFDHPVSPDKLVFWMPLDEGAGAEVRAVVRGQERRLQIPASAQWVTESPLGMAVEFTENEPILVEDAMRIAADEPFALSFWMRAPASVDNFVVFDQRNPDGGRRGWTIRLDYRYDITMHLVSAEETDELRALAGDGPVEGGKWHHLCIQYPGSRAVESFKMYVNGRAVELRIISHDRVRGSIDTQQPLSIAPRLGGGALRDIRLYDRELSDEEVQLLARTPELREVMSSTGAPRSDTDAKTDNLAFRYFRNTQDLAYQKLSREMVLNAAAMDRIRVASPTTLVMHEREGAQPQAHVLFRGEYDQERDLVTAAVPQVFAPLPEEAPCNRLGLAQWLVDPAHPLTARVTVNRIWQNIFGTGIVKTAEDFGTRGEPPSHPELLDWLSCEFIESGWDMKHLVTLIVTSSTYRQSSVRPQDKLARDSDNRLLSCGPRFRLDAEVLRDQALRVSGLLVNQVGGPSVKPYQPAGVWEPVAFVGSNTEKYQPDVGAALYRRSLYTFWKRTAAPPSMTIFNAPNREVCTVRRERTNTPLQALVLLNDPQFVEAARRLAELTLKRAESDEARLASMSLRVIGRPLDDDEAPVLMTGLAKFRRHFSESATAAVELIGVGESVADPSLDSTELAAWTMLASTLLNRDDVVNKH